MGSIGRQGWCWRHGMVKVNKDEGGMMKDENLFARNETFSRERVVEGKGILYTIFPEERDPETLAENLEMTRKFGVALYIHKNGYRYFSDSVNNTRAKTISVMQEDNPEIYDLLSANKISPEKFDQITFKSFPDKEKFQRHIITLSEIMKEHEQVVITVNMLRYARHYLNDLPNPEEQIISQYIQYHLSSYFNEFFILLERLKNFSRTIKRLYGRDSRFYKFSAHFQAMENIRTKIFNEIRKERNQHVHEIRYTDAGLEELAKIEFLIQFEVSEPQLTKPLYLEKVNNYHKQTCDNLDRLNSTTEEMLDLFFGILERFVFSEQGDFIPPEETRKRYK
jgi:hypothetical protein